MATRILWCPAYCGDLHIVATRVLWRLSKEPVLFPAGNIVPSDRYCPRQREAALILARGALAGLNTSNYLWIVTQVRLMQYVSCSVYTYILPECGGRPRGEDPDP